MRQDTDLEERSVTYPGDQERPIDGNGRRAIDIREGEALVRPWT